MEKRIGAAIIIIEDAEKVDQLNKIISAHADMIIGRQGIPLRNRQMNVISLVLEGTTDEVGSLTGKLGKVPGIRVKSVLAT
ncbi:MAG: TM1266 family iron-only hydrogenase system putative regulator [Bacteroidales bacterium]